MPSIVRKQYLRLHEHGGVDRIELAHYLAGLLYHRLLVLTHGDCRGLEGGDVGGLAYRIAEEAHRDSGTVLAGVVVLGETSEQDLLLHSGVALEPLDRHEVHIVEGQFRELADLRLDEQGGPGGVKTSGHVVERDLDYVLTHLLRVVGVVGESLGVGDHYVDLVELPAVLELDPAAQRPHIMPDVETAGGPVARKNYLRHQSFTFLRASRTLASISSQSSGLSLSSCFTDAIPWASFSSL